MFFGRIWGRGGFTPSWRSYAAYAAIIALALLGVEFGVLNVLPGNTPGNLLLLVPAFYVLIAFIFLTTDAGIAAWRWFRARRGASRGKPAAKPRGVAGKRRRKS